MTILDKVNQFLPTLGKVAGSLKPRLGGRPPVAVELSTLGALAACGKPPVYGFAPLRAGVLAPSATQANLSVPQPAAEAIRVALEAIHPGKRVLTLLVPDTTIRILVLDFDSLPTKAAEALPLLRLRLRKIVPFDVEKAAISYQMLPADNEECRVLIAVMPGALQAEYEAVVRAAGYEPGAILPAGLAALNALNSPEPALVAHLSPETLTTAIVRDNDLLLYRTLELPADEAERPAEMQRDIAVAMAFFEDKIETKPETIHYTGCVETAVFAQQIDTLGLKVVELAPRPETGAATTLGEASLGGVTGALAGAAR